MSPARRFEWLAGCRLVFRVASIVIGMTAVGTANERPGRVLDRVLDGGCQLSGGREAWIKRSQQVNANPCNAAQSADLRAEIQQAYADSVAAGVTISTPTGIDITDRIKKILAAGIEFGKAEELLKCAGFDVHRRPSLNISSNRPDKFDVFAESREILPQSTFTSRVVIVTLRPEDPLKYDTVSIVKARIIITAP